MNAFQLLKNDHQIVSGLFDQIESASGREKTQLFTRLKSELDVHAHIEEKIFYPALKNKEESREITLEAYEEHKVVKDLLAELSNGATADEEWDAKLKVLRENVDHHVEEEEGELFDKASDALNDEDIDRLGEEMEAEKARQQGLPKPPAARRAEKRGAARSAEPKKQGKSPGVLRRLASLVGLADSTSPRKSAGKGGKKKAAKKSAGKAGKKSSARASSKTTSKAAKGGSKARGSRKTASKTTAKKTTKRTGGVTRKAGAKKR